MYFFQIISAELASVRLAFRKLSHTNRLVLGALLGSLAAVFQSAGGYLPGIGYLISPLATAPILFCTVLSIPFGLVSYLLTILLLLILQPSELVVFPFTTGLLGLGIGAAFHLFEKRLPVMLCGGAFLTAGICLLLYLLKFPVLGPFASSKFSFLAVAGIFVFSVIYSWIWVELSVLCFKRVGPRLS